MKFNRSTVLIFSSDSAFSREVTEHWPQGADSAEFVLLDEALSWTLSRDSYDLAIADATSPARRADLCRSLASNGKPAIVISSEDLPGGCRADRNIFEVSRRNGAWAAMTALLGREILSHLQADARRRDSEKAGALLQADATLGRYMVEMRHSVNNALTSVLGNAELLLLEPGLPATVMAQADTIRNMALRLNEVFQRFSSIEKELSVVARESGKSAGESRAAAGH